MKKISLQWRLTIITAFLIATICIFLNFLLYKNGIYYINSLEDKVLEFGNDTNSNIYIQIDDDKWDDFEKDFSGEVYTTKEDFRNKGLLITTIVTLIGGAATYFISGRALKPLHDFSEQVEKVQAQNLTDCTISGNNISEFDKLSDSYNKMLLRLSNSFEVQRQFTGNAAHELRTPLAIMQAQIDLYNSSEHPEDNSDAIQTLNMVMEQNERLSKLVKTLLDMSELQTISLNDTIEIDPLVEEVIADLEPLADKKDIELVFEDSSNICLEDEIYSINPEDDNNSNNIKLHLNENNQTMIGNPIMIGSDILIYRMIYNLVENAIKYNNPGGKVVVSTKYTDKNIFITVSDTGNGIPKEDQERIFEPFFRVDKSRSRSQGGVGLGLAFVSEIVKFHKGSIRIKNSDENGTTFEVSLPL